jgi:hypothetical protein
VGVQLSRARRSVRFLPFSRRSPGDRKAFDQTWKKREEKKKEKEEDPTANGGFAGREWKFELSGLGRKAIEKGVENTPLDKVYIITCRSFFGADFVQLQQNPGNRVRHLSSVASNFGLKQWVHRGPIFPQFMEKN